MNQSSPTDAAPAVRFEEITKRFGALAANDAVSFEIEPGSVHAILGENGAGKSTLMRVLAGLVTPDSGRVILRGEEVHIHSPADASRLGIGMLHQHLSLVPALTGLENIALTDREARLGSGRGAYLRRLTTEMTELGVRIDLERPVWALSQSEKQLLDFFRALHQRSSILILDEPTASVGPIEGDELLRRVREAADRGITVVLVTHKIREILEFASAVTVMRAGRVVDSRHVESTTADELVRLMVGSQTRKPVRAQRIQVSQRQTVMEVKISFARDHDAKRALRDVEFDLVGGEILGVAGMAGSGQDVLASIVAGVSSDFTGSLRSTNGAVERERIGFVPADRRAIGSAPDLSIRDNLLLRSFRSLPYSRRGVLDEGAMAAFVVSCIERYRIRSSSVSDPVRTLSGGNVQRLILARELAAAPAVIVAHNPTSGLDVDAAAFVYAELEDAASLGAAVLLISDDLDELLSLADRLLVLHAGQSMGVLSRGVVTRDRVGRLMAGLPLAQEAG